MMNQTATLLILCYTKIKDSAIVIHTLSRDFGRCSFLVSVSKSTPMAMFLPLNIVEADIVHNSRSTLARARNFSTKHPLNGIRNNYTKNSISLFISEVLFRSVTEGAYEEGLFDWCVVSVLTLDALQEGVANFHLRWLLEFCGELGFAPSAEDLLPFAGNQAAAIKALAELPRSEALLLPLNGKDRSSIAAAVLKYISHHSGQALEVKSLRVLGELF